jgi:hypothetical protein
VQRGTATVARSLVWTSRLLGMEVPELYVVGSLAEPIATVPSRERPLMIARSLASGVELRDLAFLWGRHLWFHRPEHRVMLANPTLAELAQLLLAALAVGGIESQAVDDDVLALADELREQLESDAVEALAEIANRMQTRGLRRRVVEWTRALHTRSARAGLIACGDLARAAELVRRYPPGGGVDPEAQIDDLRAFSIAREHAAVRERIGVALRG